MKARHKFEILRTHGCATLNALEATVSLLERRRSLISLLDSGRTGLIEQLELVEAQIHPSILANRQAADFQTNINEVPRRLVSSDHRSCNIMRQL